MRKLSFALTMSMLTCSLLTVSAQSQWPTKSWTIARPDAVGLNADTLAALDSDLANGKYGHIDGMIIIRNGKLAFDRSYKNDYDRIYGEEAKKQGALNAHDPSGPFNYFNPWWHPFYRRGNLHTLQSVTKTITSVVIGVAMARKEFPNLETPILSFFDVSKVKNIDDRKRRITIRHLLTMTSGFEWNENLPYDDPNNPSSLMEASSDWVQFVIDRPMSDDPGKIFNYNSGATELLSHIFRLATGMDIEEYAAHYLFSPLGIEQYYWKRTPTGLADTEGGLYLNMYDLAKIGYLFLNNGTWDGRQIIQPEWVKASIMPSITVRPGVKYGYKWWLYSYGSDSSGTAWAGSGFGGQVPMVLPEYDLIFVVTAWNILDGMPRLRGQEALQRILRAVIDPRNRDPKK